MHFPSNQDFDFFMNVSRIDLSTLQEPVRVGACLNVCALLTLTWRVQ